MSLARPMTWAVDRVDRLVPKGDGLVVRTPDVEDQGLELVRALDRRGIRPRAWLVDDTTQPHPPVPGVPVVGSWSPRGLGQYWRSRVVVHTHGAYGARPGAASKVFVNLWHGMPVKRLPSSEIGRNQTDIGIATAPVHARHFAETWEIDEERLVVTGLPRNDLLARERTPRPPELQQLAGDRPLVVWLPTFRRSAAGEIRVDGRDLGTRSQLEGANPELINELFRDMDVFGIMKLHPMTPPFERVELPNLIAWSHADLLEAGFRLYELLAHADVLVTDHSSVWIDFLLTRRPVVFAISDLDQYRDSRGYYFADIESLLPGPIAEDLDALGHVLPQVLTSPDPWHETRRRALELHHTHRDAGSADRVADLVQAALER